MLSSQRVNAVVNWYKAALSQARAQELSKVVDGEYMLLNKIICAIHWLGRTIGLMMHRLYFVNYMHTHCNLLRHQWMKHLCCLTSSLSGRWILGEHDFRFSLIGSTKLGNLSLSNDGSKGQARKHTLQYS